MIAATHAREILDSRGYPTVDIGVTLHSGHLGRAAVPAGSSTGRLEAVALRDGGERWSAMGVSAAVEAVQDEFATTEDTSICDLAVATGSAQIKAGAPSRERVAKYNRLLRIEEMLGASAHFAGLAAFYPDTWEASA